jgi:hypothetical protein
MQCAIFSTVLRLEHIPLKSIQFERQEYAQAFESGAISYRPGDSTWPESALELGPRSGHQFALRKYDKTRI